ncbi:DUF5667 domain-containing protein [Dehalobacter restrictus]|uniref:Hemagglutinin n=1 Tax=Dehalobacter restrictus (strain DSM 9455 / PER-K23) TaxID=871738 RepID=A0ABN4BYH4_DEHRP|nr:DUF5667 domain-containing protein [Dehalobacter restrictus]AHF10886.1 hemagglutinin [Dehalobacter restrictus DSM 9455]
MIRKKILVSILCVFLIIAVAPTCVFAETTTDGTTVIEDVSTSTPGTPTEPATDSTAADPTTYTATTDLTTTDTTTTDAVTTDSTITDSTVQASTADEAGVTPDSWLYSLEQMIESVQVAVTFSDEGKAELLVEFANERLAEAEIMSEQNQLDLMEQALKAYSDTIKKANFQVQQMIEDNEVAEGTDTTATDAAADDGTVTTSTDETVAEDTAATDIEENTVISNLLASIELVQRDADKVVLKISGNLTEDQAEIMQNIIKAEVQNTIAIKAYVAAKKAYGDAVQQFAAAKAELGEARASGDEAAIAVALEKVEQAEQYKNDMQELRKDVQKIKVETNKETKEVLKEQTQNIKEYKKANKGQAVSDQEDSLEAGDEQDATTVDNQDVTVTGDQTAIADDQPASDETTVDGTSDESGGTVNAQSIQNTVTNTSSNNGHNGKGQGKR